MKTHLTFLILLLVFGWAKAQNWQPMGPSEFGQLDKDYDISSLAVSPKGIPYVAFPDD